jgi:flavin reductase (DIM6/NTAB) family NADH-FMN oxidoreductase RutF
MTVIQQQATVPPDERFHSVGPVPRPTPEGMGAVSHGIVRVVAIMTAISDDGPYGMTVSSLTPVSFDPPMMLVALRQSARMLDILTAGVGFGLSILAADQQDIARYFAGRRRPRGQQQFHGFDHRMGPLVDTPLLSDAIGWLECRTVDIADTGDHALVIGEVLDEARNGAITFDPLLHGPDGYRRLRPHTTTR